MRLLPSASFALVSLALALALVLAALGASCASSDNKPKQRRERTYDGPVIDLHTHLVLTGHVDEADAFRKNAADPRLQKVGAIVTAPQGKPEETKAQNDRVLALVKENAKIVPIPSVHPADGQFALDELERVVQAGAKLIALHVTTQGIDLNDARVGNLVQRAGERGVTVLIEAVADPTVFSKVLGLALRHPQTTIIVAGIGVTDFHDAAVFALMTKYPGYTDNVWFDVSLTAPLYVNSPYEEQLAWVIRRFPKKVLFGSDFPLFSSGAAIDAAQNIGLTEGEQADVLFGNAARLLGEAR